jgi:lysozyme
MTRPSAPATNAMVNTLISQGQFKDFVRKYRQKYYTSLNQAIFDPRIDTIFGMLKATAESSYKARPGSSTAWDIETDAVVFAIAPYTPAAGSSEDAATGIAVDATSANWSLMSLKCYILSDPRSLVASPNLDIVLEAFMDEQTTGVASPVLDLLPSFTYDPNVHIGVLPTVGDVVKVKCDSSAYMAGICTAVTKVNVVYMLANATEGAANMDKLKSDMNTSVADILGEPVECIDTGAPRYNPASMSISPQGKKFLSAQEGYRGWVYDDQGHNSSETAAAAVVGAGGIGGSAASRWKWADYYMPRNIGISNNWYTAYKPGAPWGPDGVPTIGDGHAIKVQDPGTHRGSLLGPTVNERKIFDRNFKEDLTGTPSRATRQQQAGANWASKKARIGYNPGEDPAPISRPQAEELRDVDIAGHTAYFKSKINVPITQNQFDAMASICFNKGPNFWGLRQLVKELNKGNCDEAAKWFMKSDETRGTKKPATEALIARRKKEAQLFAGYGYAGTPAGTAVFQQTLQDHRQAAAEQFVASKGEVFKWVGKSGWFDASLEDTTDPAPGVAQVTTVGQNTPLKDRTPCSYLYPTEEPGSTIMVYGPAPGCDQTG